MTKADERVDVNVSLGHWPFMDFTDWNAECLIRHLKDEGISKAWVSSTESILFPEPDRFDRRLLEKVKGLPALEPVVTVNPVLGNACRRLHKVVEQYGVRLVRILPNYHGYAMEDPRLADLARALMALNLTLVLPLRIEDERNQYPMMQVPAVPVDTVSAFANRFPDLRIAVLNGDIFEVTSLMQHPANLWVDIAFVERMNTLETLLQKVPVNRVLFGSHTPFFYTRSAVLKMKTARIDQDTRRQIEESNARRCLGEG